MFEFHQPITELSNWIKNYQFISFNETFFEKPLIVTPSGDCYLTILSSPTKVVNLETQEEFYSHINISFIDPKVNIIQCIDKPKNAIIIRFHPGAVLKFFNFRMQKITEKPSRKGAEIKRVITDTDFLYKLADKHSEDLSQIIPVLDSWFLSLLNNSQTEIASSVLSAQRIIADSSGTIDITELPQLVYMSRTALFTRFKEVFGVSPKVYARIVRMNAAYIYLLQNSEVDVNIMDFITRFKFYDYSHFIKEFRYFFGVEPQYCETNGYYLLKILEGK